ncbi:MAG: hypothetical protein AABX70_07690 [Nanoarchaeota archaeon]
MKFLVKAPHEKLPLPPGHELFDLGIFMEGISDAEELRKKMEKEDLGKYKGKTVQIRGCGATWAYMIVSHQLEGIAKSVLFRLGDGKTVEIW